MTTFSMTPVTGFPPATASTFPEFIQFQDEGINLGGPDADTVNFVGNVSATRGEGENANVITVDVAAASSGGGGGSLQIQQDGVDVGGPTATTLNFTGSGVTATGDGTVAIAIPGGGGSVEQLVVRLSANGSPQYDGSDFQTWNGTVQVVSTEASWSDATGITFLTAGVYEIVLVASFGAGSEAGYPQGDVLLRAQVQNTDPAYRSTNRTDSLSSSPEVMTNSYIYDTTFDGMGPRPVILVAESVDHSSFAATFSAQVIVRRLGDAAV